MKNLLSIFKRTSAPSVQPETTDKSFICEAAAPPVVAKQWAGDEQLRALAQDHKDGLTQWVIASDMVKLFEKIDSINQARDEHSKIIIHLSKDVSDKIAEYRAEGLHLTANIPRPVGTLVLTGDLGLRYMGVQYIGENSIMLECQGRTAKAFYAITPFNSNLNIEMSNGKFKSLEFGMDKILEEQFNSTKSVDSQRQLAFK